MDLYVLYKAPFQSLEPRTDLAIYQLVRQNEILMWLFITNVGFNKIQYHTLHFLPWNPGELQIMYNRSNIYYYTLEFKESQIE